MRKSQVDIVPTQHQMIADGDAGQFWFFGTLFNLDQGQIHGAAADVDDQQQPSRL